MTPHRRVAALFDIHGNLPALEAVLREVHEAGVDQIVVGGDVLPGPMPRGCLDRLLSLDPPARFIHGNCELSVLAQMAAFESGVVTYWGTTSGRPLPESDRRIMEWTARLLYPDYQPALASWPKTLRLEIGSLGAVLFCHGTPRSEIEVITRLTREDHLASVLEGLDASVVVCGHTHMQFDRRVGSTRLVNAGSVGNPFGVPGAYWALLSDDVELRCTRYDLAGTAEQILRTAHPSAAEIAEEIRSPAAENTMLELFAVADVR